MAKNWEIDPGRKDYVMTGGSPQQTDSTRIPAYFRLKVRRGKWLYAPDATYGSNFHTISKRRSSDQATLIENTAAEALQPLIDDNRAFDIEISTTAVARHGVALQTKITENNGEVELLNLPQV